MKTPRNRQRTTRRHKWHRTQAPRKPRSRFKQPSKYTSTFNSGELIPFYVKEILPNDTIQLNATIVARLATPIYPIMDNIYIDTQFFYIPGRLLWDNFERFMGAQDNPGDSTDYLVPQVTCPVGGWGELSNADYFGMPTKVPGMDGNALLFRALNLTWNEWYRDQNLQDSKPVPLDDGPDLDTDYPLLVRGKRHDYFTSGLPFLQKGDPVEIPIGDKAPLVSEANFDSSTNAANYITLQDTAGDVHTLFSGGGGYIFGHADQNATNPATYADLTQATATTINDLRLAVQTQAFLELNARAGTRYPEYLFAHWGVPSQDARLQRPEYLGGGSQPMGIHQVANTAGTGGTGNADLGAFGQSVGSNHGFMRTFPEHGYVIGLISARADMTYQQGMPRMFSNRDRFDFALPIFAHIGEQAILNKEIFAQGTPDDDLVFAYTERYNEYRYDINKVTGLMRSNATTPLDAWHLALDFEDVPVLSPEWIEDRPPISRIIATPSEPEFKFDAYFNTIATRCLPVRGTPGTFLRF